MLHRYLNLLVFALLFLASCDNRPKDVLSPSAMTDVLADLSKAEALFELDRFQGKVDPEEQYRYRLGILEKHNTNKAQLDSSIVWYNRDPKKLDKIFHRVVLKLEEEKKYIIENPITRRGTLTVKKEEKDYRWFKNLLEQLRSTEESDFTRQIYPFDLMPDDLMQKFSLPSSSKKKRRYAKEMRVWSMSDLSLYYLSRDRDCDFEEIPFLQWCESVLRSYKDEPLVFEGRLDSVMLKAVELLPPDSVSSAPLKKE